jgi:hypothetical protein
MNSRESVACQEAINRRNKFRGLWMLWVPYDLPYCDVLMLDDVADAYQFVKCGKTNETISLHHILTLCAKGRQTLEVQNIEGENDLLSEAEGSEGKNSEGLIV